jgi:hypothetical protein
MNVLIAQAIRLLAGLLLGSEVFDRIIAAVERWASVEVSNAERRHGVLDELQIIGIKISESAARLGVELAVSLLKRV